MLAARSAASRRTVNKESVVSFTVARKDVVTNHHLGEEWLRSREGGSHSIGKDMFADAQETLGSKLGLSASGKSRPTSGSDDDTSTSGQDRVLSAPSSVTYSSGSSLSEHSPPASPPRFANVRLRADDSWRKQKAHVVGTAALEDLSDEIRAQTPTVRGTALYELSVIGGDGSSDEDASRKLIEVPVEDYVAELRQKITVLEEALAQERNARSRLTTHVGKERTEEPKHVAHPHAVRERAMVADEGPQIAHKHVDTTTPDRLLHAPSNTVAQPKPDQVTRTKSNRAAQPKPDQVTRTKSNRTAQPKPDQVTKTLSNRAAQPKPDQAGQPKSDGTAQARPGQHMKPIPEIIPPPTPDKATPTKPTSRPRNAEHSAADQEEALLRHAARQRQAARAQRAAALHADPVSATPNSMSLSFFAGRDMDVTAPRSASATFGTSETRAREWLDDNGENLESVIDLDVDSVPILRVRGAPRSSSFGCPPSAPFASGGYPLDLPRRKEDKNEDATPPTPVAAAEKKNGKGKTSRRKADSPQKPRRRFGFRWGGAQT